MRTTSLQITQEQHAAMYSAIGADLEDRINAAIASQDRGAYRNISGKEPRTLLNDAVGHLSLWALPQDQDSAYHHCVIRCTDTTSPELVACYYPDITSDKPSYVIGAIWHGDHFGFHS